MAIKFKGIFKPGWFQFFQLVITIIAILIIVFYSLDIGHETAALLWYRSYSIYALVLIGLDIIFDRTLKISLMPTGDFNPKEFVVQKMLGYNGAVLFALVFGIALAAFFGASAYYAQVTFFPIANAPSQLSTIASSSKITTGLIHSIPATFVENPLLILIEYGLLRQGFKLLFLRIKSPFNAIFREIFAISIAALAFPFIFHYFAYQGIEPAYWRAFLVAAFSLIPIALTGIPLPLDLVHFTNNFVIATLSVVAIASAIVYPKAGILFATMSQKITYPKKINKVFKAMSHILFK